jgi:hypothetical protein
LGFAQKLLSADFCRKNKPPQRAIESIGSLWSNPREKALF